jgi:phage terminase large subunit
MGKPTSGAALRSRGVTMAREVERLFRADLEELRQQRWPNPKYAQNPVAFVREVLHEEPMPHQAEIMMAVASGTKVAVRSGQKTGKTKLLTWLAIWFYCSFPRASVNMSAATAGQVKRVLWRELKATLFEASRSGEFQIEKVAEDPATGINSEDGRALCGFTTRDIEAMGGISSPNLLFLIDEASALGDAMAEAIEGNRAGGAKMLWISNPTRAEGPFFEAFHSRKEFWKVFHLDSEEVAAANDNSGRKVRGVATSATIASWAEEYGRDSPFFLVRVKGEFLRNETGKVFSLDSISQAQIRHVDTPEEGRLRIGIDPAGPGLGGDDWGFSLVRGLKQIGLFVFTGLTEEAAWEHLKGFLLLHRRPEEIPIVIVDSEGPIGGSFFGKLRGISESLKEHRPAESFDVFGARASSKAKRQPMLYERVREELWAAGRAWVNAGGAILSDHKLEQELHLAEWIGTVGGLLKVTPKDEWRERLGRSPDRADAFLLSVWEPAPWLYDDDGNRDDSQGGGFAGGRRPMPGSSAQGAESVSDPFSLLQGAMGGNRRRG